MYCKHKSMCGMFCAQHLFMKLFSCCFDIQIEIDNRQLFELDENGH